jgi:ABC-type Fe3+/spermidine/putrescine transport system ATPase subunit
MDLAAGRAEVFALVGPSGSGKTTLLKIVSGIEVPDSGQVWLSGQNVTAVPSYRRRVHTVFQNYALFPHLDVAGNVGFPMRVAGMPRQQRRRQVLRALSWVKLDHFASRRVDSLSGGERQRVALARALVDDPDCVLLDEPLSSLDPHLRAQTLELLQDLQTRLKVTYLYVTHDREEALRAAHRVGVLHQGRLEQVGTPEEVYHRPRTAFVASFVGPINWLNGELAGLCGRVAIRLATGHDVPLDGQPLPGARAVRLGVRPEDVQLGSEGFFSACVVNRQFSGSAVSLRLTAPGGLTLSAELRGDRRPPQVGEVVGVTWAARSAHLFTADDPDLAQPEAGRTDTSIVS